MPPKSLAAIVLALILSGCGAERPATVTTHETARMEARRVSLEGGSSKQRALLRAIVDRLRPSFLEAIEIRTVERVGTGYKWATMSFVGGPRRSVRADWERNLIAGVFRDLSRARGLPDVIKMESAEGGAHIGPVRPGHAVTFPAPPRASRSRVNAFVAELASGAENVKARVRALTISPPYGLAATVRLQVDDPASFLSKRLSRFLRAVDDRSHEGVYLEVVTADGNLVWRGGWTTRIQAFRSWVRPDLAGCFPARYGPPRAPPECPDG